MEVHDYTETEVCVLAALLVKNDCMCCDWSDYCSCSLNLLYMWRGDTNSVSARKCKKGKVYCHKFDKRQLLFFVLFFLLNTSDVQPE